MDGTITVSRGTRATVHTYTSPAVGWEATSHLIELPEQVFVVDAQYMLRFAEEVVAYANRLEKPIARLYVTHYHPDHLLGAAAIDAPIYALDTVRAKIESVGDRVAGEEYEKHGDAVAKTARRADYVVADSAEQVDGVLLEFRAIAHAETEDALVIALPDERIVITQDLIYQRCHLFLGERRFREWRAALEEYRSLPYDRVLPGHGLPGGKELYDEMIEYLNFAERAYSAATDGEDLKRRLLERFPDYGSPVLLDHQQRFMFPKQSR